MGKLIDITGNKYNMLTVLGLDHMEYRKNGATRSFWKCKCDCGNIVILRKDFFIYPYSKAKSCGCLYKKKKGAKKRIILI